MRYELNHPEGIKGLMQRHPGIHNQLRQAANKSLAIARSNIHNRSRELSRSGRVEDAGIQPVYRGQARMTMRVVFHAPYAALVERKTGFLSAALGRGRKR